MEIRAYQPKDFDALIHLLQLNTPKYFAKEEEADFSTYLKTKLEHYFVLELKEQIIGSGGVNFKSENVGIISWGMIHPAFQHKGYGSKLLNFRLNLLLSNPKIEKIIVRTTQLVFPFYQKSGFTLLKIEKDYWGPGFDLYLMEYNFKDYK